jgi:uncharacterized membrane protein
LPALNKEQLLSIIRDKQPSTFGALRHSLAEMRVEVRDEELTALVTQLSAEGLINLAVTSRLSSFSDYLIDVGESGWMYCSLVLALIETLLVESRTTNDVLVVLRLAIGFALLGFLPGYSMMRLVFPRRDLALLEQFMLSVFLSILVSILTGVVLGSLGDLQATSNTLLLTVLTFGLSLGAAYRAFAVLNANRNP